MPRTRDAPAPMAASGPSHFQRRRNDVDLMMNSSCVRCIFSSSFEVGWCSGGEDPGAPPARSVPLVRRYEVRERREQWPVASAVEVRTVVRDAIACDRAIGQHKQSGVDDIIGELAPSRERGRPNEPGESYRIAAGLSRVDAHDIGEKSGYELTDSSRTVAERRERADHLGEDRPEDPRTRLLAGQRLGLAVRPYLVHPVQEVVGNDQPFVDRGP